MKKILIPLANPIKPDVLIPKLSVISERGDKIVLFHVLEAPETASLDTLEFKDEIAEAEKWLKKMKEELGQGGIDASFKVALSRNIPDAIVSEAQEGEYDIILMLKRRRTGVKSIFKKSISETVSRRVEKPVVTYLVEKT